MRGLLITSLLLACVYHVSATDHDKYAMNHCATLPSTVSGVPHTFHVKGECALFKCHVNVTSDYLGNSRTNARVKSKGCSPVLVYPPCKVTPKDFSKQYPACCPRLHCPPGYHENPYMEPGGVWSIPFPG